MGGSGPFFWIKKVLDPAEEKKEQSTYDDGGQKKRIVWLKGSKVKRPFGHKAGYELDGTDPEQDGT